jgi:hypothetical protein
MSLSLTNTIYLVSSIKLSAGTLFHNTFGMLCRLPVTFVGTGDA